MNLRYGLAVSTSRVAGIVLRGEETVFSEEVFLDDRASLAGAVRGMLDAMPRGRFRRPNILVAVGPDASQVRVLSSLPVMDGQEPLHSVVQLTQAALFTQERGPVLTGGVFEDRGSWWAAAVDGQIVSDVVGVCSEARVGIRGFVPVALVLRATGCPSPFIWSEGHVVVEVKEGATGDMEVRRLRREEPAHGLLLGKCAVFGNEALPDAAGAAALSDQTDINGLIVSEAEKRRRLATQATMVGAGGLLALSLGFLGSAAVLDWDTQRLQAEAAEHTGHYDDAIEAEGQVHRLTKALHEHSAFDAGRISVVMVLHDLAERLPAGTLVDQVTMDPEGFVRLSAESSVASNLLESLSTLPGLVSLEVDGPITHASGSSGRGQRVSIVLRIDPALRRFSEESGAETVGSSGDQP